MIIGHRKLVRDEAGANLVEYILLVGVIALICIVAFQQFGGAITSKVNEQKEKVGAIGAN